MGLGGVTTGGRGGEFSGEFAWALTTERCVVDVSFGGGGSWARDGEHRGGATHDTTSSSERLGLRLATHGKREWTVIGGEKRGWDRPGTSIVSQIPMPGDCVEASCSPDTSYKRSNVQVIANTLYPENNPCRSQLQKIRSVNPGVG